MDTREKNKQALSNDPRNTQTIGQYGEQLAEDYLVKTGMSVLERNFSSRFGEIDLILQDQNCIVFVEVRLRKNAIFGTPLETINRNKQQKLRRTAQYYCQYKKLSSSQALRFDVVGIVAGAQQNSIEWVANAF